MNLPLQAFATSTLKNSIGRRALINLNLLNSIDTMLTVTLQIQLT